MQNTSALYKEILSGSHEFETKISVAGHEIGEDEIFSINRYASGLTGNKPSVGGALSSTLEMKIAKPSFSIPKMGEIDVFARAKNASQTSEWMPQGVYFIDTRSFDETASGVENMKVLAYDAMLKAEQDYPDTSHNWPYKDALVVAEIASAIGVAVDPRTNQFLTAGYLIDLPIGYTMRETLEHIAAAYGGNFVISPENKLLFVPLYGLDPKITGNYLADESGNALVLGDEGWYILV